MEDRFLRTEMLIGEEGVKRLSEAHVAVFGVGGVGGYVVEALARCGVGELTLVDRDVVSSSNLKHRCHRSGLCPLGAGVQADFRHCLPSGPE